MKLSTLHRALCGLLASSSAAAAMDLNINSQDDIKQVASTIAHGMMSWYNGNETGQTPGLLPQPYYWWEAGAMFGAMVDYWYYTGDDTYQDITMEALVFQASPTVNYMPANQTKTEGNDDQGFWGLAVMSAAEAKFPNPPDDDPQYLELAQGVFNSQAERWDTSTCGGGLRWQIFTWNNGYDYKNSISNGCFFQIAARLGAYTGNQTYLDWADKTWNWMWDVGLISPENGYVFDGSNNDPLNCTEVNHMQWSYNAGIFLYGAAVMYNKTTGSEQDMWKSRVNLLVQGAKRVFFTPENIMYEVACEPGGTCDQDQVSFKAYLSRWMAATTKVAPFTIDTIMPLLQTSAVAAAKSCSGGDDGTTCGTKWTTGSWDGAYGPGQQMSALEVVQSNLIDVVSGPVGNKTGGTSRGNPAAGTGGNTPTAPQDPITTGDRAGAGVVTALILIMVLGGAWWMVV